MPEQAILVVDDDAPIRRMLDVAMPGLDGVAVCRRLRAKGLAVPVPMLTARDDRARVCPAVEIILRND